MQWSDYMVMAAQHSRNNAQHWFRYLRKYIDKCGILFSIEQVDELYRNENLTPFQRVSIRAAFNEGSQTRQHIKSLNQKVAKRPLVRDNCKISHPLDSLSALIDMGFDIDISILLDAFECARGMEWLEVFYRDNESDLQSFF